MSDKLKKFIDENRKAFDSSEPDARLFQKIRQQMNKPKRSEKMFSPVFRLAAAAVLVIALTGTLFLLVRKKEPVRDLSVVPATEDPVIFSDPVYAKQISHFQEVIGLQQSELKKLEKEYPQLYKQFVGDINELDSSYQALKENLSGNLNRETLLEAMIQNLQLQSKLLSRQLQIIKEVKQKKQTQDYKS